MEPPAGARRAPDDLRAVPRRHRSPRRRLLRPDHGDLRLVDAEDRPWAPLPAALAPNPEHDPRLQAVQERGPTVLLWAVLLLVGGGLAGVTLRLGGGRSATGPGGSDPQEPDQAGSAQQ